MEKIPEKKMGRPTNNPKTYHISVKLDEDAFAILYKYCEQKGISHSEGVRRGVKKLGDDIKEE